MFIKIKVSCPCHCTYTVNEDINSDKVICPNCGKEYPYSAQCSISQVKFPTETVFQTNIPLRLFLFRNA